jgi:predicted nucleic acid-binding protein
VGSEGRVVVSNSGPLIHLARIYRLNLLKELFGKVAIPTEVKIEVVDRGKEEGAADAFLIESEIKDGWIVIEEIDTSDSVKEIAKSVGIEIGETAAIMLSRRKNCPILLDDLAARRFATGLGLEVAGSIGVLIRSAKIRKISKIEALDALERLARVMWLSVDVYEDARKTIGGL